MKTLLLLFAFVFSFLLSNAKEIDSPEKVEDKTILVIGNDASGTIVKILASHFNFELVSTAIEKQELELNVSDFIFPKSYDLELDKDTPKNPIIPNFYVFKKEYLVTILPAKKWVWRKQAK